MATTTTTSDHHQQQPRRQGSNFVHPSGIQYPSWEYDLCEVRAQFLAYETYKLLLLSFLGGSKSIRVYKKYLSLCSQKKWETTIITQTGFVILLAGVLQVPEKVTLQNTTSHVRSEGRSDIEPTWGGKRWRKQPPSSAKAFLQHLGGNSSSAFWAPKFAPKFGTTST